MPDASFPFLVPKPIFCRVNPFSSLLGPGPFGWITLRRMDLSEFGEAAAFLRVSEAELLLLQALPLMLRLVVAAGFALFYCFQVATEIFDWLRGAISSGA